MNLSRKLLVEEKKLLQVLIKKAELKLASEWVDNLSVIPLDDGKMGSLLLIPPGISESCDRLFGEEVSEYQFTDVDGIKVIASLYLDSNGELFELDIWKTDFSPLINFPIIPS